MGNHSVMSLAKSGAASTKKREGSSARAECR
ncbi:Uncharacterised protein [Mycobacteroides abscessus]|nr:Uncharacterised protein [Mycobacteroides abscessus]